MPNYPREQLLELYKSLPKELQTAIFSADNADKMSDICQRNGAQDDKTISEIAKNTGYVLMGVLKPEDLQSVFEKEIGLQKEVAKQIFWEISRFIFLPVKTFLEAIYNTDFSSMVSKNGIEAEKPLPPSKPKRNTSKRADGYREPIN